jgi:hypothetical protein
MPELTENQIADLRALEDHCRSLGADLVIIGAIAYQVHFPREDRHTGDIDFAVALDLDEFAELERRLLADKWVRFFTESQTVQYQSITTNKIPQISISTGIWFGTRGSEVQILSPRPFVSST